MVWIKSSISYLGRTMRFRSSLLFLFEIEPAFSPEGYNNTSTGWDMWLDICQGCFENATICALNICCIYKCTRCYKECSLQVTRGVRCRWHVVFVVGDTLQGHFFSQTLQFFLVAHSWDSSYLHDLCRFVLVLNVSKIMHTWLMFVQK